MLTRAFDDALLTAAKVHRTQTRKGTRIPYVSHVLGVASIALEHGANEEQAIAALLHDAIEDGDGENTRREIRDGFGPAVERIVVGCSDSNGGDKAPWLLRKCRYLAHLPSAEPDVLLVSAADKLHNMRTILTDVRDPVIGQGVFERFKAKRNGTLWYYGSLVEIYRASGKLSERLVAELVAAQRALEEASGGAVGTFPEIPELPNKALVGTLPRTEATELLVVLGEMFRLSLHGVPYAADRWLYFVESDDQGWELLDEDDPPPAEEPDDGSRLHGQWFATWGAAMARFDRFPWPKLHPDFVHPAIADALSAAFDERAQAHGEDATGFQRDAWRRAFEAAKGGARC